jgi:hypothetical protein
MYVCVYVVSFRWTIESFAMQLHVLPCSRTFCFRFWKQIILQRIYLLSSSSLAWIWSHDFKKKIKLSSWLEKPDWPESLIGMSHFFDRKVMTLFAARIFNSLLFLFFRQNVFNSVTEKPKFVNVSEKPSVRHKQKVRVNLTETLAWIKWLSMPGWFTRCSWFE